MKAVTLMDRHRGYVTRRAWIEEYFDRTAAQAWARLTSDAPVSGIRATVRAGRDKMRSTLAGWLPDDLTGHRVLDAGCGTGQMAITLARRGADVLAIDLSKTLTDLARERVPADIGPGRVRFIAGDMFDPVHGQFDHVVAMDSLIHYSADQVSPLLAMLAARTRYSVLFTFAPRTILLSLMHGAGRMFPRQNRSPSIEPVAESALRRQIGLETDLTHWQIRRTQRISTGFYTSQAAELISK